jgi:pSer/pThr/pTyr-binding forkhead associated (FHA) protein
MVTAGTPNKTEIQLQKIRTNIGRLVDVYKSEGLSRRNDLAFAEDNPINRTVSREHAHILHDKQTGEYRLFNDRWYTRGNKAENNCGLWIVRDGMGQEVHRDTRGTKLLPGDEIHLGKAVLKFQIK